VPPVCNKQKPCRLVIAANEGNFEMKVLGYPVGISVALSTGKNTAFAIESNRFIASDAMSHIKTDDYSNNRSFTHNIG
jgi:hypothetical protein